MSGTTLSRYDSPRIIVVTGVMAAGKSTVSQLLAERFSRGVHLRGDIFRRFVVSGRVEPTPQGDPEGARQLTLRHTIAARTADLYAEAGFTVVVQDVFIGPSLAQFLAQVHARPLHVVLLAPDVRTVMEREQSRGKRGYGSDWSVEELDRVFRRETPQLGVWIDSSAQTPEETVDEILDRLEEARTEDTHAEVEPR